jgi:CDP-diacylglycerol--glycerol-3-phosphate 3-phosphatidyltransferase
METSRERFTISNVITVSRLFLLPFIVYFLLTRRTTVAFVIMLVSLLTDVVDGYFARRLRQVTHLGELLDPLCDKISLAVILATLVVIRALPLWAAVVVVGRDFLILIGSLFVYTHRLVVFRSNWLGKLTGFLFGAMILAYTINLRPLGRWILFAAIACMMATFVTYIHRYIRIMKGAE